MNDLIHLTDRFNNIIHNNDNNYNTIKNVRLIQANTFSILQLFASLQDRKIMLEE